MRSTVTKSVALLGVILMAGGVCTRCETDPEVELDEPTYQINPSNPALVTITGTGLEGNCLNQPPYDDYYLYARLIHNGVPQPEIGPYGWQTDPYQVCPSNASRQYRSFEIRFEDVPFASGDTFTVQVRSNEGEGFDPFTVTSPMITVP